MLADFRASAIIGVKLPRVMVESRPRIRGCDHPITTGPPPKFCCECGRPTWKEGPVCLPPLFRSDDRAAEYGKVVSHEGRFYFWGRKVTASKTDEHGTKGTHLPVSMTEIEAVCRKELEPLELWDEAAFGLWAVCHTEGREDDQQ